MDWATLVTLYPVVADLIKKMPDLKDKIEKLRDSQNPGFAAFLVQLEMLEQLRDMKDYILTSSLMSARLSCPNWDQRDLIESWKFARQIVIALRDV